MNFADLYNRIVNVVTRPELDSHIRLNCIQAVRSMHSLACFPRDLEVITVPNNDITFTSSDLTAGYFTLPSEIRYLDFVQSLKADTSVQGNPFKLCSLGELHKRKLMRDDFDTCYLAGNNINFKSSSAVSNGIAVVGYVYRPSLSLLTNVDGSSISPDDPTILAYHDWLMDGHEGAVVDYTFQYVCSAIGEIKLAKYYIDIWQITHREAILNLADLRGN